MSVYRSYFSKQATLINKSLTNTSKNPIIEFSYGGTNPNKLLTTRYVFQIDISNLIDKIDNFEINKIQKHTLHIKNVVSLSKRFHGEEFWDAKRANNLYLQLYELNEDFEEGTGFDYLFASNTVSFVNKNNTTPANWYIRKGLNTAWTEEGTYTASTPSNIIATQYFEQGNEDIEMDITDYINDVISEKKQHKGLGLSMTAEYESFVSNDRYVMTFYSRHTNSFYEPYLQTWYDNNIYESRCHFRLDEDNELCLVTEKEIASVDKVEIYNSNNELIQIINEIDRVDKYTYKINLNLESEYHKDYIEFRDKWYYTTIDGKELTYTNRFITAPPLYISPDLKKVQSHIVPNGINENEIIQKNSGVRRVYVMVKSIMGNGILTNNDGFIDYTLYVKQGKESITVIPFTNANRIHEDVFFDIDTTWLIPQQYYLDLRLKDSKNNVISKRTIPFRIAN